MSIHIGTSGWAYDHWQEVFYPPDLDHGARLAFYSQHFKTVEVNNTFYNLPEAAVLESWKEQPRNDAPLA